MFKFSFKSLDTQAIIVLHTFIWTGFSRLLAQCVGTRRSIAGLRWIIIKRCSRALFKKRLNVWSTSLRSHWNG